MHLWSLVLEFEVCASYWLNNDHISKDLSNEGEDSTENNTGSDIHLATLDLNLWYFTKNPKPEIRDTTCLPKYLVDMLKL